MKINGIPFRSIRLNEADGWSIRILDQTRLPWQVEWLRLIDEDQVARAIRAVAPAAGVCFYEGVTWDDVFPLGFSSLPDAAAGLGTSSPIARTEQPADTRLISDS